MLGKCFSVFCLSSIAYALVFGDLRALCDSVLLGASKSVTVIISIIGFMTFWNGVMEVLKDSGIISFLSRLLTPLLKHIFPSSFKNKVARDEITACISAGVLGLSNATTPLAISAIEKMNEGRSSSYATKDMITLAIIGCACFNLIPTTIISMRVSQGASISYEIIVPVWICSFACMSLGIILSRVIGAFSADR
ncbi:MAG: hypothetical protein IJ004_02545 [Clostridia bacterium]|nr:hypothetical protein [Clostridia bacterium]